MGVPCFFRSLDDLSPCLHFRPMSHRLSELRCHLLDEYVDRVEWVTSLLDQPKAAWVKTL